MKSKVKHIDYGVLEECISDLGMAKQALPPKGNTSILIEKPSSVEQSSFYKKYPIKKEIGAENVALSSYSNKGHFFDTLLEFNEMYDQTSRLLEELIDSTIAVLSREYIEIVENDTNDANSLA